jgi:hypothetical protein
MNQDQLKQAINFDYQLSTFAIGLHQFFLQANEKGTKLSLELIDFAQKFGNFVHEARKEGLSTTPIEG